MQIIIEIGFIAVAVTICTGLALLIATALKERHR